MTLRTAATYRMMLGLYEDSDDPRYVLSIIISVLFVLKFITLVIHVSGLFKPSFV